MTSTDSVISMKKIIFCIPGNTFSNAFLSSWSETLLDLTKRGHQCFMANREGSPWFVRNSCLGGNALRGINQQPYDGKVDYDYIVWLNHDIVFSVGHVNQLLEHMRDESKMILGGVVPEGEYEFDLIDKGNWSFDYFMKHGRFQPFTRSDLVQKREELFEVDHVSMKFLCMRKGVLESIEYPWCKPLFFEFQVDMTDASGNTEKRTICDYCSDDIAVSRTLVEKGYTLWVDPMLTVGREQTTLWNFPHRQFVKEQKKQGTYEDTLNQLKAQNENSATESTMPETT